MTTLTKSEFVVTLIRRHMLEALQILGGEVVGEHRGVVTRALIETMQSRGWEPFQHADRKGTVTRESGIASCIRGLDALGLVEVERHENWIQAVRITLKGRRTCPLPAQQALEAPQKPWMPSPAVEPQKIASKVAESPTAPVVDDGVDYDLLAAALLVRVVKTIQANTGDSAQVEALRHSIDERDAQILELNQRVANLETIKTQLMGEVNVLTDRMERAQRGLYPLAEQIDNGSRLEVQRLMKELMGAPKSSKAD